MFNIVKRYRIAILLAIGLLALAGGYLAIRSLLQLRGGGQEIPVEVGVVPENGVTSPMDEPDQTQASILLSPGQAQPQTSVPLPIATGVPLTGEEIQQILQRLPGLVIEAEDQGDFRLAGDPIPPPRTGDTVEEPFPPAAGVTTPGDVETGPLEVLRFAPEGEIPIAPFVNITFNQPMVPVGTLEDLALEKVPVRLEPNLPGTWRWLGTKTLTFQYDSDLIDRLPKATEYHVTIPAGTRSAVGGELAESVAWTFSLPPAKLTSTYPYDVPQPLEPLFFIAFDQRINTSAVLETIQVTAGSQPVSIALASEANIKEDAQVNRLVKNTPEGRWLAFRAKEPLPADTRISVTVGPGTPSAEGPLLTKEAQSYSFSTYAPLRIEDHGCSWYSDQCLPLTPLFIRFNNPIDTQVYKESMLRIRPELPGASINIFGNTINIQGATEGRTTYTVVVDGDVQDIFGQKLGTDQALTFKIGPAEPLLVGPDSIFVTLDPVAEKPIFSVYTINYSRLNVRIYAVQPSDWPAFKLYLQEYQRTDNPPKLPGRLVRDESLRIESPADKLSEVDIDLSPVMDGKFGHYIVVIEPPRALFEEDQPWLTVHSWVQVTQIGIDAIVDHSDMVAWATALNDGSPLQGVTIQAGPAGIQARTDETGLARFPIPDGAVYLVASQGADQAMLPRSPYLWDDGGWYHNPA